MAVTVGKYFKSSAVMTIQYYGWFSVSLQKERASRNLAVKTGFTARRWVVIRQCGEMMRFGFDGYRQFAIGITGFKLPIKETRDI